ncbi:MAG: YegP family protein [Pseudomonadales bacterium]|jgi:uncharacterized protein YegP (UPF0339 family)|nr:YegP family protein [Pseudomonadales bacterium]
MPGKFEIYKDKAGEFRFRLKASNGQNILSGEGYKTKASAMNGVKSVMKNAAEPKRFESKISKSGKPCFVLKAGNSQVIGQSQMYDTEASCKAGIASVAKNAPGATIEDLTTK